MTLTTCSALARRHRAELAGTAPVAVGWMLVEQPGSWGAKALTASRLDPTIGAALEDAAGDDVRVQVVRRPGRADEPTPAVRTVLLAHAGTTPWAERLTVGPDGALADLDPTLAAAPHPPGLGVAIDGPLWLVCTNGRRDRCCATYGRPIADALAARHGDHVWEVNHIGGHRFAGNLLHLPSGEVFGGLSVADALEVVHLHDAGRLHLSHLRGRSGLSRAAQAAEVLARRHLGVDARDAVRGVGVEDAGDGAATVHLEVDGSPRTAVVRQVPTGMVYAQSCDAAPEDPGRYELVALT